MLRMTASAIIALCALVFAAFIALEGCGSDPWTVPCASDSQCGDGYQCRNAECWPACGTNNPCPTHDLDGKPVDAICYEGFCYLREDLPPDAGTDADSGKTSAICGDSCTPVPEGWSSMQAVWFGPIENAPFYGEFYGEKTLPRFTGRADLEADPAECDACSCAESTGKCTELPSSIEVHAATCGQASSSLFFGGPTNWDGSCTNANSIPAGQKCPVGSSTLCAQSVAVSPLGAPVDESCAPSVEALADLPVLKLHRPDVRWKTAAVGYDVPGCDANESCMPSLELPSGFRSCIYQHGEHECPAEWSNDRHVVYEVSADKPGYIDARDCTPCSCGAPVGSLCVGQFRVFEDAACTKLISADPITSIKGQCTDILPPGKALGGKEITSLAYVPGTCEVLGGEPIGAAIPDENQSVTFCCQVKAS